MGNRKVEGKKKLRCGTKQAEANEMYITQKRSHQAGVGGLEH